MGSLPIVVGITGASGAVYARRLVQVLLQAGRRVELVLSPSAKVVFRQELGIEITTGSFSRLTPADSKMESDEKSWGEVFGVVPSVIGEALRVHGHGDFMAPIASGSHRTAGMVICPCSGTTLGGLVSGAGGNLIQRAAEVHLKERRKLILVPRETPLSLPHLENLRSAHLAGAVILPASPGWYHEVRSLEDLVDFIVARILDQLDVEHQLMRRWGSESSERGPRPAED